MWRPCTARLRQGAAKRMGVPTPNSLRGKLPVSGLTGLSKNTTIRCISVFRTRPDGLMPRPFAGSGLTRNMASRRIVPSSMTTPEGMNR
ncbi:hypothetical protein JSE7799_00960 [Jannaschia seosinensis]|uniref:Uncharacterized protein n=1 Tax=Jannaschia seosinensis TaxID=313367 RepID=A0A0M7BA93_9RHOB|nr:hypothetical protein JSE7799_00960 [Jannaschia seosinensis]